MKPSSVSFFIKSSVSTKHIKEECKTSRMSGEYTESTLRMAQVCDMVIATSATNLQQKDHCGMERVDKEKPAAQTSLCIS